MMHPTLLAANVMQAMLYAEMLKWLGIRPGWIIAAKVAQ